MRPEAVVGRPLVRVSGRDETAREMVLRLITEPVVDSAERLRCGLLMPVEVRDPRRALGVEKVDADLDVVNEGVPRPRERPRASNGKLDLIPVCVRLKGTLKSGRRGSATLKNTRSTQKLAAVRWLQDL